MYTVPQMVLGGPSTVLWMVQGTTFEGNHLQYDSTTRLPKPHSTPTKLTNSSTLLTSEAFLLVGRSLLLSQDNPQLQRGVSANLKYNNVYLLLSLGAVGAEPGKKVGEKRSNGQGKISSFSITYKVHFL